VNQDAVPGYHLAQLNVGRPRGPLDDPVMAGFLAALVPINALADASPGFVWRLQTEDGDATSIRSDADPTVMVNMSVWESVESLRDFVYHTRHLDVLRDRREWFERMAQNHLVLWWVERGTEPTIDEAFARLADLERHGPSEAAFTLRVPFPPPATAPAGR
jgi:hypothetical protein